MLETTACATSAVLHCPDAPIACSFEPAGPSREGSNRGGSYHHQGAFVAHPSSTASAGGSAAADGEDGDGGAPAAAVAARGAAGQPVTNRLLLGRTRGLAGVPPTGNGSGDADDGSPSPPQQPQKPVVPVLHLPQAAAPAAGLGDPLGLQCPRPAGSG